MRRLHPFDVLVGLTLGIGVLPLRPETNAAIWWVALIAGAIAIRHGSVALAIVGKRASPPRLAAVAGRAATPARERPGSVGHAGGPRG